MRPYLGADNNRRLPLADQQTDNLYAGIRQKFGQRGAGANGYQMGSFFRREQALLYSLLRPDGFPLLDIACGSGLMLAPSLGQGAEVIGLDFNQQACLDAQNNSLDVVRGDAFALPFASETIAQVVNCQFLNQQNAADTQRFIKEVARVLKPDGQLLLFWRHADSLFHRLAGALVQANERLRGAPVFPQFTHPMADIEAVMASAGLTVVARTVSVPFGYPRQLQPFGLFAKIIGASLVLVAQKPAKIDGSEQ